MPIKNPRTPLEANTNMSEAADILKALIVKAKWSEHELVLPVDVVAKLIEAKEAIFAAQRILEQTHGWSG